ncbi:MAG TPA: AmpG family muropeptide MFS transporter, partial [Crinalium sp.]
MLTQQEVGAGASMTILGYRIALLLTGWIAFNLADRLTWPWVYGLMALLMVAGLLTSFGAPEPTERDLPPESLRQAVVLPFVEFLRRLGWQQALFTLIFIIVFK